MRERRCRIRILDEACKLPFNSEHDAMQDENGVYFVDNGKHDAYCIFPSEAMMLVDPDEWRDDGA